MAASSVDTVNDHPGVRKNPVRPDTPDAGGPPWAARSSPTPRCSTATTLRRRGAITIDGDRIVGVTADAPLDVTFDDRVVDVGGRTVMPGMVTCHFHSTYRELGSTSAPYGLEHPPAYQALLAADHLRMALDAGFTGAVGAGCAHDIDASMKRAIDNGVIPGPRFVPSGHELSTTGHSNDANPWYWDMRGWGVPRCATAPTSSAPRIRDEIKRGVR